MKKVGLIAIMFLTMFIAHIGLEAKESEKNNADSKPVVISKEKSNETKPAKPKSSAKIAQTAKENAVNGVDDKINWAELKRKYR